MQSESVAEKSVRRASWRWLGLLVLLGAWPPIGQAAPIRIVAAENFYGDVAAQLGGSTVRVTSILSNPNTDPHLFEASPATARALFAANLVIFNGIGYDPWITRLLVSTRSAHRRVLEVASVVHARPGANPHLWYDPAVMPQVARALTAQLQQLDPAARGAYAGRLRRFLQSLQPIDAQVALMRRRFGDTIVTATEPLPGYLVAAIGLRMVNQPFQLAVMNDTQPAPRQVAAFERSLRSGEARVLIFNRQTVNPSVRRLLRIARAAHVPVVGMTETEPAATDYQQWMLGQLRALDRALEQSRRPGDSEPRR